MMNIHYDHEGRVPARHRDDAVRLHDLGDDHR